MESLTSEEQQEELRQEKLYINSVEFINPLKILDLGQLGMVSGNRGVTLSEGRFDGNYGVFFWRKDYPYTDFVPISAISKIRYTTESPKGDSPKKE